MKKRSISVIFSLFACLFLLISTGCSSSNSFSGSDQTGILNLEIVMNNNSRMILPDIDMTPVSYVINGAGPDGAAFTMNTTDTLVDVMELAFGTWVIAVDGYNGEGTRIAYGTETVEVHTGETTPIDIIVSPLTGNGTLNVLLTWESEDTEIPSIESQLIASDGTTLDLDFEINANGDEGTYTNDALPAGYYTLSVKLLDNGIYTMGGVEIVRIVEGAETNGTIYFPEINKPGGNIGFAITANMGNPIDVTLSEIPGTIDPDATVEVTASVPDGTGDVFHTWYLNGNYAGMGSTANPTYTINAAELKLGNIYRLDVSTFSADGNRAGSASAKFKIEESALTWKYYHVFNQETGTPEIGHAKINDMPGTRALAIYDFLSETQTGDAIVLNAEGAVYSGDGTGAIYVSDCPVDSKSELVFTLDSRNDDTEAGIHSRAKDYSGATIDEIHGNGFMNVSVYYDDSSDTIIVNNNGYKHNLGSASGWTGSEFKIIVKQYGRLVQVDLYRAGIMQYQSNAILPEVLVSNVTEQFIVPYARKNITLNRFAFMDQVEAPFDPDNPIVDTTEPVGTPYTEPTNLWLYSHLFNKVEGEALDPSGAETNVENRFSIQSLSGNVIMGSYGLTIQGTDDFDIVMGSESPSNIHAESILKFTESGQHLLLLRGNNIEEIMSGGEDSSCLIVGMMLDNDEIILSVQEYMNGSIDGGVYGDNLCVNGCDLSDWIDQECRLVVDVFNKKVQAKLYKNDVLAGQLKFSLSDSSSSTGTQSGFLLDKNAPVKQYRFFEQTEEPFSGSGIDPINYGRLSYDGLNTGDSVVYHDFTIDGNGPLDLVPPQHRTAGHLYYQWIVPTVELPYDVSPGDYNMPEIAAGSGVAGEEDGFFTQMISQHSNCLIEMEVQLPEDELDNDTSICLWFRGGYGLWYFQKYRSFVFGFPGYLIGVYTVPEGDPFYDSSKIQKIGVKLVDHTMKFYLNDVEIGSRETGLEEAVVNPNIHGFGGVFCTGVMYKSFKITPIFGVSGKIKTAAGEPIEGVTVNLTGDATAATLTGRNGEYQFELPKETASYTVSPSFANHAFTPETRTVDITAATHPHGITGIDFAAADQGMRFEYIQPGTFLMGSPEDELGRDTDETQHEVTVTQPFYIQTTEVTRYRWKTVMGNVTTKKYRDREMDLPATSFSWDEIQDFIAALNSRGEGTYRLPTEAEWEYAARAGSITAFANGDISESSNEDPVLNLIGWYSFNSRIDEEPGTQESRRVGEKIPNAWGLYDMHGNVSEWCQDWYAAYPTESVSDPVGPSSGSRKVIRGGSYSSEPANCRSANREYGDSDDSRSSLGFRLIWTPEP